MTTVIKASLPAHGSQQKPGQQLRRGQTLRPNVAQSQMATASQLQQPPKAPTVYRPQPQPVVLQPKMLAARQHVNPSRSTPTAPPVYHPLPVPRVLQPKIAGNTPSPFAAPRRPIAPPAYRPEQRRVVQPKIAVTSQARTLPKAPPVYHPEHKHVPSVVTRPTTAPARPTETTMQMKASRLADAPSTPKMPVSARRLDNTAHVPATQLRAAMQMKPGMAIASPLAAFRPAGHVVAGRCGGGQVERQAVRAANCAPHFKVVQLMKREHKDENLPEVESDSKDDESGSDVETELWYEIGSKKVSQGSVSYHLKGKNLGDLAKERTKAKTGKKKSGDTGVKSLLDNWYEKDGKEYISDKRSFNDDRYRQTLRWLSTVLLKKYGGVEIQCYYDSVKDKIYISSNLNDVNRQMDADRKSGTLLKFALDEGSQREIRHLTKLSREDSKYDEEKEIKKMIMAGKIEICPAQHGDNGRHAERRINEHLHPQQDSQKSKANSKEVSKEEVVEGSESKLDFKFLGGTKRACMTCAVSLDLPKEARPGPLWSTAASSGGIKDREVKATAKANKLYTHVTRGRADGKLTADYGSESDSDA